MKCPHRTTIVQADVTSYRYDFQRETTEGVNRVFYSSQEFQECHEELCACWDREQGGCGKMI